MIKHKGPKQTHINVAGPGGSMTMQRVVDRAPFLASSLTAGERHQVVEVCMIRMVQLNYCSMNLYAALRGLLVVNKCDGVLSGVGFFSVLDGLFKSKVLLSASVNDVRVTNKGVAYLKRCPKKIRVLAARIIGSPLDQLAAVI